MIQSRVVIFCRKEIHFKNVLLFYIRGKQRVNQRHCCGQTVLCFIFFFIHRPEKDTHVGHTLNNRKKEKQSTKIKRL